MFHQPHAVDLRGCILMCVKTATRGIRTSIVLDQDLVAEASRLTGIRTRRTLVHAALRVLVEQKRRRSLTELRGKVKFAPGYDHKAARVGER